MEKKILALGCNGKLVIKTSEGRELPVVSNFSIPQRREAVVYLLIDCSSSMEGQKIEQVKQGSLDFARTAFRKGYLLGLIKFEDSAHLICEPTAEFPLISKKIKELFACGGTNLTEALRLASQRLIGKRGYKVAVIATDGFPNEPFSALEIAEEMKKDRIEILAISTEDANQEFLSKLVSRKDLNLRVERNQFREGFKTIAKNLPVQRLDYKR